MMSFHCELHPRLYSDKAVQTECSMATIPRPTDSSGAVLSSGIADLAINELLSRSGSAYTQSKPSRISTPSLSGGPVKGKTWLDYNHPSLDFGVQRRVVSHPDSLISGPKTPYADSEKLRVVSLPEPILHKSCVSKYEHQGQDPERQSPHHRGYPSDLPQTPSPPSSPDSVVIVGNETYAPSSFFQPHNNIDEKGWTTWGNSPPRPIPALHGPSSLPYARCPSGAEGTIVEGDDLATKIWGLGSDEGHRLRLKSPQPPRPSVSSAPLPVDDNIDYQTVTSSALARHRDAVIDLAKPSSFYCHPEAYDSVGVRLISFNGTSSPAGHAERHPFTGSSPDMHSVNTTSTKDRSERTSVAFGEELVGRRQGLPQISPPTGFPRQSILNSAAPSFVPAFQTRNTNPERDWIRQDAEFGDLGYSHTARDLCQHQASDLTPASTTSPLWSPVFQSVPTIVLGDYNPRVYSPQTDLDGHSNEFIAQQLNSEDLIIVQQKLRAEQGIKSSIETFYEQPYATNNDVGMKDTKAALSTTHPSTLASRSSTASRTESRERRCHLSHQQPRSFPMARLAQRRLSSVVEENALSAYELPRRHATTVEKISRWSALVSGQSQNTNAREPEISAGGEV